MSRCCPLRKQSLCIVLYVPTHQRAQPVFQHAMMSLYTPHHIQPHLPSETGNFTFQPRGREGGSKKIEFCVPRDGTRSCRGCCVVGGAPPCSPVLETEPASILGGGFLLSPTSCFDTKWHYYVGPRFVTQFCLPWKLPKKEKQSAVLGSGSCRSARPKSTTTWLYSTTLKGHVPTYV